MAPCEGDSKGNTDLVLKAHFLFPFTCAVPVHQLPKFFLGQGPSVQGPVNVDRNKRRLSLAELNRNSAFPSPGASAVPGTHLHQGAQGSTLTTTPAWAVSAARASSPRPARSPRGCFVNILIIILKITASFEILCLYSLKTLINGGRQGILGQ